MKSKAEMARYIRRALEMLERAKYGCEAPGSGDLAPSGPVDQSFAIGYAAGALRNALDLPDQSAKRETTSFGQGMLDDVMAEED